MHSGIFKINGNQVTTEFDIVYDSAEHRSCLIPSFEIAFGTKKGDEDMDKKAKAMIHIMFEHLMIHSDDFEKQMALRNFIYTNGEWICSEPNDNPYIPAEYTKRISHSFIVE